MIKQHHYFSDLELFNYRGYSYLWLRERGVSPTMSSHFNQQYFSGCFNIEKHFTMKDKSYCWSANI